MRTIWLFGIGLICAIGALVSLAAAHENSQHQVAQILQVDQTTSVPVATMTALQTYVTNHMGAGVTFRLNGAYNRDLAAAQSAANTQPSDSIYHQAQAACASIKIATQQAACNEQYLSSHLQPAATPAPVTLPNIASYTYTLKAPIWTPDRTGFLMAVSVFTLLIALFQYFSRPSW